MMIDSEKIYYTNHLLTPRSSCLHSSQLALKTSDTCQTGRNFKFSILHGVGFICVAVQKNKNKKNHKNVLLTTVANNSAQKEKKYSNGKKTFAFKELKKKHYTT